jgi:predicted nuclease of predicted toxin-antitoxin system
LPEIRKPPSVSTWGRGVIIWLDAHLSPSITRWISETFAVECASARELGLHDALDPPIFAAARAADAIVMTKDADFASMVERLGPPPRLIWLRCGNTSNAALKELLIRELPDCMARLSDGAAIIELGRDPGSDPGVGADQ